MGTLSTAPHSPVIPLGHCTQWWDHRIFPGVMMHPAPAAGLKRARDTGFGTGGHNTLCTVQPWIHTSSHLALTQPLNCRGNSMTGNCHHLFFQENQVFQANTGTNECCNPVLPLQPEVSGHPTEKECSEVGLYKI